MTFSETYFLSTYSIAALAMSVREVQIMLARLGYCEEATSLALLHGLDLDVVFDLLVDKYLGALAAEQE
jgi:hypothetical protein